MHLIKKYSLVTSRKKLPLNYSKPQHQWYSPPGPLLAGWKSELFSLSNLFFTAVTLFLSSFNATMHINCLLPSHKLYYIHYNYGSLDRAKAHICLMLFPSSVLSALNVYSSSNSSPRSCFLLPFGLHSWSFQLVEKRFGGRLAAFTVAAYSLLLSLHGVGGVHQPNILRVRRLSILLNSTNIQDTQGSCLCLYNSAFNLISCGSRVIWTPQNLKYNPFL